MRREPQSRVILSDEELAARMRANGEAEQTVRDAMAERRALRAELQTEYDNNRMLSANDRHVREEGAKLIAEAKKAE
jgi:hypothetical protein